MSFGVLVSLRGNHSDQLRIFYLIIQQEKTGPCHKGLTAGDSLSHLRTI